MRTRKAWTWVGAFGPELMLCAASARIGPARASWWALWDGERLHERSHRRAGPVEATPERVRVDGLVDHTGETRNPRAAPPAGAGELVDGRAVTWNLVDGLHDGLQESERAVWIDGVPHHVAPQRFHGLEGVGDLRFTAVATRARRERLLLISSDYEQPFGTFAGSLPLGGELRAGWGVMERHLVRW